MHEEIESIAIRYGRYITLTINTARVYLTI